jgi:hypothetical protein
MKKNLLLFACIAMLSSVNAIAQDGDDEETTTQRIRKPLNKKLFVGTTAGYNSSFGTPGFFIAYKLKDHININIGGGRTGFGAKFGTDANLFIKKNMLGWNLNAGLNYNSINVKEDSINIGIAPDIYMVRIQPTTVATVSLNKHYRLYNNGRIFFGAGYAFALNKPYTYISGSNPDKFEKFGLNVVTPGGLLLQMGLCFGIK